MGARLSAALLVCGLLVTRSRPPASARRQFAEQLLRALRAILNSALFQPLEFPKVNLSARADYSNHQQNPWTKYTPEMRTPESRKRAEKKGYQGVKQR